MLVSSSFPSEILLEWITLPYYYYPLCPSNTEYSTQFIMHVGWINSFEIYCTKRKSDRQQGGEREKKKFITLNYSKNLVSIINRNTLMTSDKLSFEFFFSFVLSFVSLFSFITLHAICFECECSTFRTIKLTQQTVY